MTIRTLRILLLAACIHCCSSVTSENTKRYIFFLHNKFIEMEGLNGISPEYGHAEYHAIINSFRSEGFIVLSETRPLNTNANIYATKITRQVDSLLKLKVKPSHITVIGTSKGGYIAQYVSSMLKNPGINFVFVGSCLEGDVNSGVSFCGNVLSIYEQSDEYGQSCSTMLSLSRLNVPHYREIRLNTGARHGYLYKALPLWINPAVQWAKSDYELAKPAKKDLTAKIDSLLETKGQKPFNGVIMITHGEQTDYVKVAGFSNLEDKTPMRLEQQFVIGSISKQVTAAIILQEVDKGRLKLHVPIKVYLPEMKQAWMDSVTVHHLLTHTHGIASLDEPLKFRPGTACNYSYSFLGFQLLATIAEKTSGKTFAELSDDLFKSWRMNNTSHPALKMHTALAQGYTESGGKIERDSSPYWRIVPAGGFISGAYDLVLWNRALHGGGMLSESSYTQMIGKKENTIRQHPVLGTTEYGYGITVTNRDSLLQLGQTGLVPGFASMNFYFPATKTSLVILENIEYDRGDVKNTFRYHAAILELLRAELLAK